MYTQFMFAGETHVYRGIRFVDTYYDHFSGFLHIVHEVVQCCFHADCFDAYLERFLPQYPLNTCFKFFIGEIDNIADADSGKEIETLICISLPESYRVSFPA